MLLVFIEKPLHCSAPALLYFLSETVVYAVSKMNGRFILRAANINVVAAVNM